jgi:hypothetical protein
MTNRERGAGVMANKYQTDPPNINAHLMNYVAN